MLPASCSLSWISFLNIPPYYEKDTLTDRNERFFVSEIIREKIFKLYEKEIPYSTEVIITAFKEEAKDYPDKCRNYCGT